jgi:hypothetical protein
MPLFANEYWAEKDRAAGSDSLADESDPPPTEADQTPQQIDAIVRDAAERCQRVRLTLSTGIVVEGKALCDTDYLPVGVGPSPSDGRAYWFSLVSHIERVVKAEVL